MEKALEEAKKSGKDLPIGAVIVKNGEVISSAHNEKEALQLSTKHAEIIAIEKASEKLNRWRLDDCDLYVTLEPCPMCAWAILQSRIKNVYFGSYDSLYGALTSKIDLRALINSKTKAKGGIMEAECDKVLNDYFRELRNADKK